MYCTIRAAQVHWGRSATERLAANATALGSASLYLSIYLSIYLSLYIYFLYIEREIYINMIYYDIE